jgi:hypothetical protein
MKELSDSAFNDDEYSQIKLLIGHFIHIIVRISDTKGILPFGIIPSSFCNVFYYKKYRE